MNVIRFFCLISLLVAPAIMMALQFASEKLVARQGVVHLVNESLEIYVCTADLKRLHCWDYSGRDRPEIAKSVNAADLDLSSARLRFRQKNRLIVLRHTGKLGQLWMLNSLVAPGTKRYTLGGQILLPKVVLNWSLVAVKPGLKTGNFEGSFYSTALVQKRVEVRRGATVRLGKGKVTLVGWHPVGWQRGKPGDQAVRSNQSGVNPHFEELKQWTLEYKTERAPAGYFAGFLPMWNDGSQMKFVDRDGRPVRSEKVVRPRSFGLFSHSNVRSIVLFPARASETGNVDPKFIEWLQPTVNQIGRAIFRDVPLDPK